MRIAYLYIAGRYMRVDHVWTLGARIIFKVFIFFFDILLTRNATQFMARNAAEAGSSLYFETQKI